MDEVHRLSLFSRRYHLLLCCNVPGHLSVSLEGRTDHPDRSGNRRRGPARGPGAGRLAVCLRADCPPVSAAGHQPDRAHDGRPRAGRGPRAGDLRQGVPQPRRVRHDAAVVQLAVPDRPQHRHRRDAPLASAAGLRDDARHPTSADAPDEPAAPPAPDPVERQELGRALEAALAELRPDQRAAIVLRYENGLSFDEIGAVLGVPEVTARSTCTAPGRSSRGC